MSRLAIDWENFFGEFSLMGTRAGVASPATQIPMAQELASPDGLLTHEGALLPVGMLI